MSNFLLKVTKWFATHRLKSLEESVYISHIRLNHNSLDSRFTEIPLLLTVNGVFGPTGEDPVNAITLANKLLYLESSFHVILVSLFTVISVNNVYSYSTTNCRSTYGFNYGNGNDADSETLNHLTKLNNFKYPYFTEYLISNRFPLILPSLNFDIYWLRRCVTYGGESAL